MTTPSNFKELADILIDLIRTALPVITGLALMVFFWGLAKFIFRLGGDEKAVEEGKKLMLWGLIALFILLSFMEFSLSYIGISVLADRLARRFYPYN